jgi:hypothetical protein
MLSNPKKPALDKFNNTVVKPKPNKPKGAGLASFSLKFLLYSLIMDLENHVIRG